MSSISKCFLKFIYLNCFLCISISAEVGYEKYGKKILHKKTPRHILNLSTEEKREFLDSFDMIFSDIDGVVWNLYNDIEGAPDGFRALEKAGKNLTYITNNSVRHMEVNEKKFKKAKLNVDLNNIWHPSKSIVKYLKSIDFEGLIYVIAAENFKRVLREAGFHLIDGPNVIIEDSFTALAEHVFDKEPVRAVIIDVDFNLSSMKLIRAHLYLRNPDCLLIAGASDMFLPVRADTNILGPGHFLKILKEASKKEPIILGKPGASLAELLKKEYNIKNPRRAIMIGDMLEQDVGFGTECGFQTVAVLSGGSSIEDIMAETNPRYIPDYYADSMRDFVDFINDIKKSRV